jgi:hypothetical protein
MTATTEIKKYPPPPQIFCRKTAKEGQQYKLNTILEKQIYKKICGLFFCFVDTLGLLH